MINKSTIDKIFETARIDEVVGDFVPLKKRGVNLIGLCPFHNEKTPSFNVNPARNIFKCFGCGKGGTAVNFIMEHEHCSYPDALRYIAKKYNIEIEEEIVSPEQSLLRDEKESMLVLNAFAQKYFSEQLFDHEDGKAIGLSYFKERGFAEQTIKKFQLGYSLTHWEAFSNAALDAGFVKEFLVKTGLSVSKDSQGDADEKNERLIDRFRGRVMFPIHNLSGRVIAFGGRILKKDEKVAKYINSPESEVYHKSNVLYGIYFAKNAIIHRDNCYLVEGYTDVISLHQAGIENVVASSGTALTVEQIRLIGRYTKNITILYDGDPAGIKASMRGIDLVLEEGLHVKVVLFSDGDDPDSYSRKHSSSEVYDFITNNAKDFVVFKTGLLLDEVKNDPVRKAGLIREVVETIAKIPDEILRSTYVKHCSSLMDISEQVLLTELNKIRRGQLKKEMPAHEADELLPEVLKVNQTPADEGSGSQEREIMRLLLNFGNHELHFDDEIESIEHPGKKETVTSVIRVSKFIADEIERDQIGFEHPLYAKFFSEISVLIQSSSPFDPGIFLNSEDPEFSSLAVELLSPVYVLSENWAAMHQIVVPEEEKNLKDSVEKSLYHLKNKRVMKMLMENQRKIKEAHSSGEEYDHLIEHHKELEEVKMKISKVLGIDILK
ncbi:MAG: DNA primase [Bacteroidetes bacterium]|nr:DNA primase [Bacteroidota bacterium]